MLAFIDPEERVPQDHPLRTIKRLADQASAQLSPELDAMYADSGRPSIPPVLGTRFFSSLPGVQHLVKNYQCNTRRRWRRRPRSGPGR